MSTEVEDENAFWTVQKYNDPEGWSWKKFVEDDYLSAVEFFAQEVINIKNDDSIRFFHCYLTGKTGENLEYMKLDYDFYNRKLSDEQKQTLLAGGCEGLPNSYVEQRPGPSSDLTGKWETFLSLRGRLMWRYLQSLTSN